MEEYKSDVAEVPINKAQREALLAGNEIEVRVTTSANLIPEQKLGIKIEEGKHVFGHIVRVVSREGDTQTVVLRAYLARPS